MSSDRALRDPRPGEHRALHLTNGDILIMAPINAGESSVLLLRPLGDDPQVARPDTRRIADLICRHLNGATS